MASGFFVTEGTLAQGAACYVVRQADERLYRTLLAGEFAYVLDSRQKGKSSLMVRTRERLEAAGVRTVLLDLQRFGSNLDPERWYASLLSVVGEQLGIDDRLFDLWDEQVHAGPMRKFFGALEQGLEELGGPFVVFVDEIDFVRSLPFSTDEFFAGIRECFNRRANVISASGRSENAESQSPFNHDSAGPASAEKARATPAHSQRAAHGVSDTSQDASPEKARATPAHSQRAAHEVSDTSQDASPEKARAAPAHSQITFCLLGVATPSELIRDVRITPFNVGKRIELTDFTLEELAPYESPLSEGGRNGAALLRRIHHWTNGHPYLTQKLAAAVAADPSVTSSGGVDRVVEQMFFSLKARAEEPNLTDVSRRVLESPIEGIAPEEARSRVLEAYRLAREGRLRDDDADPVVTVLKLSGLTRVLEGYLAVRNRLYFRAFDRAWVEANLPEAELLRQKRAARAAALRVGLIAGSVAVAIGALAVFGFVKANSEAAARAEKAATEQHNRDLENANRELGEANARTKGALARAEEEKKRADEKAAEAETANRKSTAALKTAEEERKRADAKAEEARKANEQTKTALAQATREKNRAETERKKAVDEKNRADGLAMREKNSADGERQARAQLDTLLEIAEKSLEGVWSTILSKLMDGLPSDLAKVQGDLIQDEFRGIASGLVSSHGKPLVDYAVDVGVRSQRLRQVVATYLPDGTTVAELISLQQLASRRKKPVLQACVFTVLALRHAALSAREDCRFAFQQAIEGFRHAGNQAHASKVESLMIQVLAIFFKDYVVGTLSGQDLKLLVEHARLSASVGNLNESERSYKVALEHFMKIAPGSSDVAVTLSDLGKVAYRRGDLTEAQRRFEAALEIQQDLAPASLNVADSLKSLGNVAASRGDLDEAERRYVAALAIQERLAPGSFSVASSLSNLGVLAADRKDVDEARRLYEAALEIQQKLAPESLDVARTLLNLGVLAADRKDVDEARRLYEAALEIQQKLAPGSLDVARSLSNLGVLAADRNDLDEAARQYESAHEIWERLAPGSLEFARSLRNLGVVNALRDHYIAASSWFERLNSESLAEFADRKSLALVRLHLGDLAGWREAARGAVEAALKPGATADDAFHAAIAVRAAPGALEDTGPLLTAVEKAAASDPERYANAASPGALLYRAGRYDEAEKRLQPSVKGSSRFGQVFLAMTLAKLGRTDEAKAMLQAVEEWAAGKPSEGAAPTNLDAQTWDFKLELRLLIKEARELLELPEQGTLLDYVLAAANEPAPWGSGLDGSFSLGPDRTGMLTWTPPPERKIGA